MIHDPRFRWFVALAVMAGVATWLFLRNSGEEYVGEHAARKAAAAKPEVSPEEARRAAIRREAGAQIAKILLSQSESDRACCHSVEAVAACQCRRCLHGVSPFSCWASCPALESLCLQVREKRPASHRPVDLFEMTSH